jgi:MFS family permease
MDAGALRGEIDGRAAWWRLARALALCTFGGAGMWSVVVALPSVAGDFGAARSAATLPFTLAMVGFAFGGVLMGRLADRFGMLAPALLGTAMLSGGYLAAALSPNLTVYALVHGLLIGVGASASFAPLMADISLWFVRRRGIAVAVLASGNYLAGVIWPPLVQHMVADHGWRWTHAAMAAVTLAAMLPLSLSLRRRAPVTGPSTVASTAAPHPIAIGPGALQALLVVAGLGCCVAMSMPQVHIVAYCGDLGYGPARGAEMLSLMLGFGIVSRVASGFIADRLGGLPTLLLGSVLQGAALLLYLTFDGLGQLYVISALFGLFQGGIVPSYAIVVREYFPPDQAGGRISLCIMSTLFGMALGGWLSGVIFDGTGSYAAAFLNGVAWNLLNVSIVVLLMMRARIGNRRAPLAAI